MLKKDHESHWPDILRTRPMKIIALCLGTVWGRVGGEEEGILSLQGRQCECELSHQPSQRLKY